MKIFVTGASGAIGSVVMRELVKTGHDVTGLVHRKAKAHIVEEAGASVVIGNLLEDAPWKEAVREAELVISCTQPVRFGESISFTEANRRSFYHGKMAGNIFLAAQGSRVKSVALTYGVQGFGNKGDQMVNETMELSPVGYERSITGAYWHIDKTSRKAKMPLINIFTGWVYGPEGWLEPIVRGMRSGAFRMVGAGDNYMSLIHIDDLAAAYAKVAEKMPLGERICMVDDNPLQQKEFFGLLARELGCKPPASTDMESYRKLSGDLAAETMTASVRVSNAKMKKFLLPELKYPTCSTGLPDVIRRMDAMRATDEVELPKVSGF